MPGAFEQANQKDPMQERTEAGAIVLHHIVSAGFLGRRVHGLIHRDVVVLERKRQGSFGFGLAFSCFPRASRTFS